MSYNSGLYEYTQTITQIGINEWNVTCSKNNNYTLIAFDNLNVTECPEPSEVIPEFSSIGIIVALLISIAAIILIARRKNL